MNDALTSRCVAVVQQVEAISLVLVEPEDVAVHQ
jgi:hypothetical protein